MIYCILGGIGNAYAVIGVTYPSGSTCTCTNGTKTLPAKDTSGSFLFLIPEAGTWIVSCTDDDHPDGVSQTVNITAQYQTERVSLLYGYVIFDSEVGNTRTGGWKSNVNADYGCSTTATDSEVGINYNSVSGANTWAFLVSNNGFKRAPEYSKIVFHISSITGSGAVIGVSDSSATSSSTPIIASATAETVGNLVIPINAVSTSTDMFPIMKKHGIAQGTCVVTVDKIYFE